MAVYLDAAAGLPLHPAAREALLAALDDGWADPSRLYGAGRRARLLLDAARQAVADVLGARPDEVSFTGSGTLAAYLGVLGAAGARSRVGTRVLHSAVEQSAVLQAAARFDAVSLPVDRLGRVEPFEIPPDTALVCLQSANHEVGTVQPVEEVADRCGDVPLLVDATQTVGRAPVPTTWSLLVASAHTWGGPPGVGVRAVRTGTRWRSPLPDDERPDRSPGLVDLPAVVAAAAALQAVAAEQRAEDARLRPLVDLIRSRVVEIADVDVVGDPVDRLPHLVTLTCGGLDSEALLRALDQRDLQVSSGSSCSTSSIEPSHVLAAMGVRTTGTVRLSLHRDTSYADVELFLAVLPEVVTALRDGATL